MWLLWRATDAAGPDGARRETLLPSLLAECPGVDAGRGADGGLAEGMADDYGSAEGAEGPLMGTNFYLIDTGQHVGRRSAAGLWCWDCGVTLCTGGVGWLHQSQCGFLPACPSCGQKRVAGPSAYSSVLVELGFAKAAEERLTGVQGCSSFSWAMHPEDAGAYCRMRANEPCIVDEYGHEMTGNEFGRMLECNCPVRFTDSIGTSFS